MRNDDPQVDSTDLFAMRQANVDSIVMKQNDHLLNQSIVTAVTSNRILKCLLFRSSPGPTRLVPSSCHNPGILFVHNQHIFRHEAGSSPPA